MTGTLRLVCLDFQAPPRCEAPLSREEALAVSTEAFPRSLPVDVRAAGGFRALKLFPAGGCVGVSHAFDGGATDDWGRAVLSARVALLRPAPENAWGRDVFTVGDALAGVPISDFGFRISDLPAGAGSTPAVGLSDALAGAGSTSAVDLAETLAGESILLSRERWSAALAALGLSAGSVARLAHLLSCARDVVLVTRDTPEARRTLTLALALVPDGPLSRLRLCTTCAQPDAEGREEVVFLPHAPAGRSAGLLSRLTGRPGVDDRVVVDLTSGTVPALRGAPIRSEAFALAQEELLGTESWPEMAFAEMHRHLLLCLEALLAGRPKRMLEGAKDLPPEAAKRLGGFVARAGR